MGRGAVPESELRSLVALASDPAQVDEVLTRALDGLGDVVRYDLAAVLELDGESLRVRCARGRLANARVRRHRISLADFPIIRRALEERRAAVLTEQDHAASADPYDGVLDLPHGHSCMVVPLFVGDRNLGAMTFDRAECQAYDDEVVELAGIYAQIIALAMLAAERVVLLDQERRRLEEQNRLLQADAPTGPAAVELLERSRNPDVRRAVDLARQVAETNAPVLITGETGSGKELVARLVHERSPRRGQPFVKLNCAALPESLVESELFGHVRGAFSGAVGNRPGRFAVANGGTLLLDEVGDLPFGAQSKLLRVLQEGTFEPVGSDYTVKVDVRVVAATHVDLERALREGRFREDLYYRLSVFPIAIPPLRERLDDLALLVSGVLSDIRRQTGRGPWRLTDGSLARMRAHRWPGNVRELVNCLERATILQPSGDLDVEIPGATQVASAGVPTAPSAGRWRTLAEVERAYVLRVLDATRGRLYGPSGAAALLGLKPSTLQHRLVKLGIRRPAADGARATAPPPPTDV